jgi:hypothetical protein
MAANAHRKDQHCRSAGPSFHAPPKPDAGASTSQREDEAANSDPLRIALCVGRYLPASETFVYDQLAHQRRTHAYVIARGGTKHASRFPYPDMVRLNAAEQLSCFHWSRSPTIACSLRAHRIELIHAHFGLNASNTLVF